MRQRLIIFTRYPEPGNTKTRLIPALGADGAAALQCEMTRHVLGVAGRLAADAPVSLEVRFEGGDVEKMTARFGSGPQYRRQGPGDLGCRLQRALDEASAEGARRVVIVGADCPEITVELLAEAFERLSTAELVLGPATDGGYYLIGLRRGTAELFTDIAWGSDRVLRQTRRRARELALSVATLPELSDVDRPEDLAVWRRARRRSDSAAAGQRISVVIPTLNEAGDLPGTLACLAGSDDVETIVVDGGSHDGTPEIARRAGCRVLQSPPGRALQLNTGADAASGELLLFLHADTRLPIGFASAVRSTLGRPGVVGGAFRLRIDAPGWPLRVIERTVTVRSRLLQMPYGDQGVFVRAAAFHRIGGFPLLPIMDDFEFIRRLRRHGRIRTVGLSATTSARRWRRLGPWRTTWINQKVILGYHLGVSVETLAAWYGRRELGWWGSLRSAHPTASRRRSEP